MSYKTILVCLTTSEAARDILPAACNLARQYDAHLIGIHTLPSIIVYPGIAMHLDPPQFHDFNVRMANQNRIIQEIFEKHVSNETFPGEWRSLPANDSNASAQLITSAYRADLVIVAKSDADADRFDQANLPKDLILNSGRPVLLIPRNHGEKPVGSNILLAWNATQQSSSAAHDSLPFLKNADQVNVLTVSQTNLEPSGLDTEGHELSASLARHGVHVEVIHVAQSKKSMGEELSFQAHLNGSNLIVMGAFGHSRFHNMFFGDATRHMLAHADLPVLFSG